MNWRILILVLLFAFPGCDHDEAVFPNVLTDDPPQLGSTTAVIEGNIKDPGSSRPVRYGFLWDSVMGRNFLTASHKLDIDSTFTTRVYQFSISGLTPDTRYYVKAYAASPDYSKIYYGNEVSFKTLP